MLFVGDYLLVGLINVLLSLPHYYRDYFHGQYPSFDQVFEV